MLKAYSFLDFVWTNNVNKPMLDFSVVSEYKHAESTGKRIIDDDSETEED